MRACPAPGAGPGGGVVHREGGFRPLSATPREGRGYTGGGSRFRSAATHLLLYWRKPANREKTEVP
jgi:hypothetical protein